MHDRRRHPCVPGLVSSAASMQLDAVSFWCFVYGAGAQRDQHSFPTRRSSDLGEPGERRQVAVASALCATCPAARSEEHTSELQSRLHLVCRLLLEKKNHNVAEALGVNNLLLRLRREVLRLERVLQLPQHHHQL